MSLQLNVPITNRNGTLATYFLSIFSGHIAAKLTALVAAVIKSTTHQKWKSSKNKSYHTKHNQW